MRYRPRVAVDSWLLNLLASLSLAPVAACGGSTTTPENGPAPPACKEPAPVVVGGKATGFESCSGSTLHRPEAVTCPSTLPRATSCDAGTGGAGGGVPAPACVTDADCTEKPNGYCNLASGDIQPTCLCNYGCTTDADCGAGAICVCGDPVGHCASSTCTSDASCGAGLLCASYTSDPGCGGQAFACQASGDDCLTDADCSNSDQCSYDGEHHTCTPISCAIGRPFLVAGSERLADAAPRADWCASLELDVVGLDPELRSRLAAHWTKTGLMEHASVAAFARFALQLLSLGAPADLLGATHEAMADELRHARTAFALASAYAGCAVGPGPLAIDGALELGGSSETEAASLSSAVVRTTIREGCVGETVAALEAAEAAAATRDATVRDVLASIAEDETRHALLAWRFVRWFAETAGESGRALVADAFASALADKRARLAARVEAHPLDAQLATHGALPETAKRELRRQALDVVVARAADALLAATPPRESLAHRRVAAASVG